MITHSEYFQHIINAMEYDIIYDLHKRYDCYVQDDINTKNDDNDILETEALYDFEDDEILRVMQMLICSTESREQKWECESYRPICYISDIDELDGDFCQVFRLHTYLTDQEEVIMLLQEYYNLCTGRRQIEALFYYVKKDDIIFRTMEQLLNDDYEEPCKYPLLRLCKLVVPSIVCSETVVDADAYLPIPVENYLQNTIIVSIINQYTTEVNALAFHNFIVSYEFEKREVWNWIKNNGILLQSNSIKKIGLLTFD